MWKSEWGTRTDVIKLPFMGGHLGFTFHWSVGIPFIEIRLQCWFLAYQFFRVF